MTVHATHEPLSVDDVTAISREVAATCDPRLHIIGVTSAEGDSGRVELLVTIAGCHRDPCVLMLNVTRAGQADFERELRQKFASMLTSHVTAA